jgi:O-antigen/teichoic acid export membrane protein
MNSEESKNAAKEGGFAWAFSLFGAGVRYLNNIILARVLGTYNFGFYALSNTIVTVTSILTSFGFPTSLVHFIAREKEKGNSSRLLWFCKTTFRITIFISLVTLICFLIFTPILASNIYKKEGLKLPLYGLALSLPFLSLYNVRSSVLQGLRKIRKKVFVERIAHPLIFSLLLLFSFLFANKMEFVLVCYLVGAVMVFLLTEHWTEKEIATLPVEKEKSEGKLKELLSFSFPILCLNFLSFFILQSDILILGFFRDPREVGIYAIASRLALGVGMPADSLGASLAPLYSALTERKDFEGLSNLYKTSTRWIFLIASFVSIILVFGSTLILWLFGKDFKNGFLPLIILTCGQLFSAAFGTNGTLITQTGHPKVNLVNSIFMLILNITLLLILVPRYGIIGASTSSALSLIGLNILRSIEIQFILKISPWNKAILKPLFSLIIASCIGFYTFFHSEIISLTISTIVFVLIVYLLGIEKEDKELIGKAVSKLRMVKNG